jgi:hypothetical protein
MPSINYYQEQEKMLVPSLKRIADELSKVPEDHTGFESVVVQMLGLCEQMLYIKNRIRQVLILDKTVTDSFGGLQNDYALDEHKAAAIAPNQAA